MNLSFGLIWPATGQDPQPRQHKTHQRKLGIPDLKVSNPEAQCRTPGVPASPLLGLFKLWAQPSLPMEDKLPGPCARASQPTSQAGTREKLWGAFRAHRLISSARHSGKGSALAASIRGLTAAVNRYVSGRPCATKLKKPCERGEAARRFQMKALSIAS